MPLHLACQTTAKPDPQQQRVKTINDLTAQRASTLPKCVTDEIKTWIFPQQRGGESIEITYPFVFGQI